MKDTPANRVATDLESARGKNQFIMALAIAKDARSKDYLKILLATLATCPDQVELILVSLSNALHDQANKHKKMIAKKLWAWIKESLPKTGDEFKARFAMWSYGVHILTLFCADSPLPSIAKKAEKFYHQLRVREQQAGPYGEKEQTKILKDLFRLLCTLVTNVEDPQYLLACLSAGTKRTEEHDTIVKLLEDAISREKAKSAGPKQWRRCKKSDT